MSVASAILNTPPHSDEYDDDYLYGERREAIRQAELKRLMQDSECIMIPMGSFADTKEWRLTNLYGRDSRLKAMLQSMEVKHLLPIQRKCLPQMYLSTFPFLCVSPENSGKSWAHLLYIVSHCITAIPISKTTAIIECASDPTKSFKLEENNTNKSDIPKEVLESIDQENFDFNKLEELTTAVSSSDYSFDPDDYITHPRYIIICASQDKVEELGRLVERMKEGAFQYRYEDLPPKVKTINVHQDEEKLALKCNQAEILIATPAALLKCLKSNFVTFTKSRMVVFDELDLTLQLHNYNIRELVKLYLLQSGTSDSPEKLEANTCVVYMFARKWTDLLKQFVNTVFLHKTLIFGSMLEATVYTNLRYDIEYTSNDRSALLTVDNIAKREMNDFKVAIACKSNKEAQMMIDHFSDSQTLVHHVTNRFSNPFAIHGISIVSDENLEYVVESFNNLDHLIHFSIPDDMGVFHQRFRLLYQNIKEAKKDLKTTICIRPELSTRLAKELYDVVTRSSSNLNSTKLQLRDYISNKMNTICWRWASHGICRVDKYCFYKHTIVESDKWKNPPKFPTRGQIKITITHLVSPNEFYFWFEAHRNKDSAAAIWTNVEDSGSEFMNKLQNELNKLKDTPNYSVPFDKILKGRVYGVYLPQETRVVRVKLLEEPRKINQNEGSHKLAPRLRKFYEKLDYGEQYEVLKMDHGTKIHVFLSNLIELPLELSKLPAQCHRGFLIGFKPTENEPNWLYKAKRHFHEQVSANNLYETTVWFRLYSNNCFWFENLVVTRRLANLEGNRMIKIEPQRELQQVGLAESINAEPSYLLPSERLATLSKWHVNRSAAYVSFAFLPKCKDHLDIFVLYTHEEPDHIMVRLRDYNKQLISLEDDMLNDYNEGKLEHLNYFAVNTFCLARIIENNDGAKPIYTINRCTIIDAIRSTVENGGDSLTFTVRCLDHGDLNYVKKEDLYLAKSDYIRKLPFQAMKCNLADVKLDFFKDPVATTQFKELIYDYTRDKNNDFLTVKCQLNRDGALYLYVPMVEEGTYKPLISIIEDTHGLKAFRDNDLERRKSIKFEKKRDVIDTQIGDHLTDCFIVDLLDDLIKEELSKAVVEGS